MAPRNIFAETAPSYYAVGLQVIPLRVAQKIPIPQAWESYSKLTVSADTQKYWIDNHPTSNIGLVLGEASNICMIDIDTEDASLLQLLSTILPPSPWERRGRKGCALAYRHTGLKTFRIKDATGKMIVECLSTGTQLVLPPSIHPDTKKPYEADTDLFDPEVLAALGPLMPDMEAILRSAIEASGTKLSLSGHTRVTDYVSPGARDVKMIGVAGLFVNGVLRGEMPFTVAVDRLRAWNAACVEKVAGDDIDIEKGIVRMAEFLIRDVTGPKKKALPEGWDSGLTAADIAMFGFSVFSDRNTAWSMDRLKTYARQEFMIYDADTPERRAAVNFVLDRIVFSDLDPLEESSLVRYLAHASECGFSEVSIKKKLTRLRTSGIEGENHVQIAQEMIAEMSEAGEAAFVGGDFWQWAGSHWEKLERPQMLAGVAVSFGHLPAARKANDHEGIVKVISGLIRKTALKETSEEGTNFANGFLATDLSLRPHDPMYGCTYTLPYCYRPELAETGTVRFRAFLDQSWGEDEDFAVKVEALRDAMAATLFGVAPRNEQAFCLHGPPKSGKSQLLRIIQALLPDEVTCSVGPDTWGDKFLPAQMFGKLLNSCGELSENKKIDGAKFKSVISGEIMTAQHKNGQPFKFLPRCAHWFATNHIPRTDDTSGGFNRRWLIFTYNKIVRTENTVLGLGNLIVLEEREAIVSWAVQAIGRAMSGQGFVPPESHKERIEEIAKANNSLRTFLLDSGKALLGSFVGNSPKAIPEVTIYNAYYTFALAAAGAKPVSMISFRQKMRELGSELDFQIRVTRNSRGGQDCVYERITLVSGNVVSLRT